MVSKQEEDHKELGLMISRIGHNWEITVNWKELQKTGQFGTPWLVNLLLKKKTQEEEGRYSEHGVIILPMFWGRRPKKVANFLVKKVHHPRENPGYASQLVRPKLEYCIQEWNPCLKDTHILENMQKCGINMIDAYFKGTNLSQMNI